MSGRTTRRNRTVSLVVCVIVLLMLGAAATGSQIKTGLCQWGWVFDSNLSNVPTLTCITKQSLPPVVFTYCEAPENACQGQATYLYIGACAGDAGSCEEQIQGVTPVRVYSLTAACGTPGILIGDPCFLDACVRTGTFTLTDMQTSMNCKNRCAS
jgi:hypothetical protein